MYYIKYYIKYNNNKFKIMRNKYVYISAKNTNKLQQIIILKLHSRFFTRRMSN